MLRLVLMLSAATVGIVGATLAADPPEPWTPVSVKQKTVFCWGRNYGYAGSILPSSIVTQGENVLASAIEVAATIGGRKVKWSKAGFALLRQDGEYVQYVTRASSEKLTVECAFRTEYDGVTRVDLLVKPKRRVKLDSLDILFPLKSDCATLFQHYPVGPVYDWDWPTKQMNAGAVPAKGLKLPFTFALWLGNDDLGIQIFSETDRSWAPADANSAVTVSTANGISTLRLNALSNYELASTWSWTFGFVATPVKPWWGKHYTTHYSQDGYYGMELPAGRPCMLDEIAKAGVTYMGCHEQWSDEQSLPRPKDPEQLRSLIKACHDRKIGLVLYAGSWMSTRSPEFNPDWKSTPIDQHFVYERQDNHDKCYYMCPQSAFFDLLVRLYDEAFKTYGMDGLYLDGPATSLPCTNTKHGCGYVGRDGKVHPTMPIWKPRETMKRIYKLVKSQPKPCIIVGHTSGIPTLPTLSFVDTYLDGEHLLAWRKLGTDQYPEEIIRAEMSGRNFGIPATQLPINGTDEERERARTVCLLHDIAMQWHCWHTADIWKAWDSFGVTGSEWVPYWKSHSIVDLDGAGVRTSAYVHKGRGALFVIGNTGAEPRPVTLRVKREGLGINQRVPLRARDACSGDQLQIGNDAVSLEVKAGSFRMVSVTVR